MTTIATLLNDPTYGLLPFLTAKLNQDFANLNLKPYSFRPQAPTATVGTGYRLRSVTSEFKVGRATVSQEIAIGRLIQLPSISEYTTKQIEASNVATAMDKAINEWSRCKAKGLVKTVDEFGGAIAPDQDRTDQKWYLVVVRSFTIGFIH